MPVPGRYVYSFRLTNRSRPRSRGLRRPPERAPTRLISSRDLGVFAVTAAGLWASARTRYPATALAGPETRQFNAVLHGAALAQFRWHRRQEPDGPLKAGGDDGREALLVLKRRLSDAVLRRVHRGPQCATAQHGMIGSRNRRSTEELEIDP
jgi:hypothetical protein